MLIKITSTWLYEKYVKAKVNLMLRKDFMMVMIERGSWRNIVGIKVEGAKYSTLMIEDGEIPHFHLKMEHAKKNNNLRKRCVDVPYVE